MTYLLIVAIVLLALAPLSHFVPSKQQRRIARLREYAAVNGLFVEYRDLPVAGDRRLQKSEAAVYYGLRLPARRGRGTDRGCWIRRQGMWQSVGSRQAVPPVFAGLPEVVLAGTVDENSCGVYWREEGGENTVDEIIGVLTAWRSELRA